MGKPNLQQTIILGILIFTLCFSVLAFLSFSNINRLERELLLVERADDLSNLILEVRRVEKNYFLYHDRELFSQGTAYLKQVAVALDGLSSEIGPSFSRQHGAALRQGLAEYAGLIERMRDAPPDASAAKALREAGQALVEHSRAVAEIERSAILGINRKLRTTLMVSMGVIALVVLALVLFVTKSILRPLRQVQEAAEHIALGTFVPLPIKNTRDEIDQIFVALNSMVEELKKRQTQLVQAQKLSSIGTLASGIAHQLNNPLNNISTSCQILMETESGQNPFVDKMMNNIAQETLRTRDIVKGLLEFSRHQDFLPAPHHLLPVVKAAERLVSSQLPSNISLKVRVPEDLLLLIDRQRLQEAFLNLMINAVQAIEPGDGTITVSAEREAGQAVISVSDTGAGMPAEVLSCIFDPFFSTKEVGQGTGLGLFIVYGIVEKHHGSIRAESEPGRGTTFFIRLPLAGEDQ